MPAPRKYSEEIRERAKRLVAEALRARVAEPGADNTHLHGLLLQLTPEQARRAAPGQTAMFEAPPGAVNATSAAAAKVAFYGTLFAARMDVYAPRKSSRGIWRARSRSGCTR